MRILHVSSYMPGTHQIWGGAEKAAESVIKVLMEDGHSCHVASTLPMADAAPGDYPVHPLETLEDRAVIPHYYFMRHYWLQKDALVKRGMTGLLERLRPDVVHFHNFNVLTFSALDAAHEAGYPIVHSIYDYWLFCPTNMLVDTETRPCSTGHGAHCIARCIEPLLDTPAFRMKVMPLLARKGYFAHETAKIDRFICLSENSRGVLNRFSSRPLTVDVIPLPQKPPAGKEFSEGTEDSVMYAGWVQARKGPDVIVKAMRHVVDKRPEAVFHLVGELSESRFESYIRGLIKDLGLERNVMVTGKLPDAEFARLFREAKVIAVAEQWENMSPVILLEAMTAKKAVVAGAVGGIPEYIDHGVHGLLARYDDPADYAGKILTLLGDADLRRSLGENAAARAAGLCDCAKSLNALLASYEAAIRRHGKR